MRQRKRTRAPKRMPCQAGHGRIGEVENRVQHGVEAIGVRKGVDVAFVELETGAEEFGAVRGGYYSAGGGGA